jgi:hypothetical protein
MLLPFLTLVDFNTVRTNFKKPTDLSRIKTKSGDFAILIPIFNDTKYLTNLNFLKQFREKIVLCTTNRETPQFIKELENLRKKYGFRITYSNIDSEVKNPWAIFNRNLIAHDAVLRQNIEHLRENYVIFIDGDTYINGDPALLSGAMKELDLDLASVRVLPSRRKTLIEHLQGVEYDIAMSARLLYPWLTSGAGMIAKKSVMKSIMKNHSLFFNGGDIEIGKLADIMGYKVGHLPMNFYTDIPSTFRAWIKQRKSWMCGAFRHSVINMHHNIRHPFHFIYFTFIMYFLVPAKILDMSKHIELLPVIIGIYVLLTFLANWKLRSRWMFLFPFYALFQVGVMIWFGIWYYLKTVYRTRNFGLIRVKKNPIKNPVLPNFLRLARNTLVIIFITTAITLGLSQTAQQAAFDQTYEPVELADKLVEKSNMENTGFSNLFAIFKQQADKFKSSLFPSKIIEISN